MACAVPSDRPIVFTMGRIAEEVRQRDCRMAI
jgi:hypothetical protein